MAQKAEEYGSHPTTFEIPEDGTVKMILDDGTVLHSHKVATGRHLALRLGPQGTDRRLGEPGDRPAEGHRVTARSSGWTRPAPMTPN